MNMRRSLTPYINVLMFVYIIGRIRKITGIDELFGAPHCFIAPKTCPNENVTFYLYTSDNPTIPVELGVTDRDSIVNAQFLNGPIKIIVHGYTGHKDYTPNMEVRPAYFERPVDVNVITVDYAELVKEPCYFHAVENAVVVAKCMAQFLEELLTVRQDIDLKQIHIIALSLGAQIAGQISNYFTMGQIERITALDAALPLFYSVIIPEDKQISRGDAKFIDAIHTNGGIKGKLLPYADVDFFANGGSLQPPCGYNHSCSHAFSAVLFAASINSKVEFWGRSCSFYTYFLGYCQESDHPWALFGEYVTPDARGSYFFKTSDKEPYVMPLDKDENFEIVP